MKPQEIRTAAQSWLQANLRPLKLIPSNVRRFNWRVLETVTTNQTLGMRLMAKPAEGKVIHATDDFLILKEGRSEFAVVPTEHLTLKPPVFGLDDKVKISPQVLRDIDGIPLDQLAANDPYRDQGNVTIIGLRQAKLDIEPESEYLRNLIETLDNMRMPDGQRTLTSALITAGARRNNITWIETGDTHQITMRVATGKFSGRLSIGYDLAFDLYTVTLNPDDPSLEELQLRDVYFDTLGELIEHHIDDGSWCALKVETA